MFFRHVMKKGKRESGGWSYFVFVQKTINYSGLAARLVAVSAFSLQPHQHVLIFSKVTPPGFGLLMRQIHAAIF